MLSVMSDHPFSAFMKYCPLGFSVSDTSRSQSMSQSITTTFGSGFTFLGGFMVYRYASVAISLSGKRAANLLMK